MVIKGETREQYKLTQRDTQIYLPKNVCPKQKVANKHELDEHGG